MRHLYLLATLLIASISCCKVKETTISVVPYPNQVEIRCGSFKASGADFTYSQDLDEASRAAIIRFAGQLSSACGRESAVSETPSRKGFIFTLEPEMPAEAYRIDIRRRSARISASGLNGFIYAIQTLRQMLPAGIFGSEAAEDADWTLPCCTINDAPRFAYRGMHLDVSRHFFDVDAVKRYIDIMETHKLNTLHWHLTDDQGWRIEIKKYPKLTEKGSVRNKTVIGHVSRSDEYDHTPYGEGCWFSQEQIKEIIDYAASRGMTVIPEIDLPGHMLAALAAYPELGCTGGPYEVWGDWGVADDVLCAGNEKTMLFLEDVLSEVCDLFPAEYIHIGGDECPKVRWEKCPRCQAKIRELGLKDDDRHKAEHYLQSYVMARMEKFINSKGKRIIGWDEILEGEVAPDATIMSWRGVAGGLEAVRLGHDAIMTPNTFYYLDYYQSLDTDKEPLAIGGYLPVDKCYSYEPFTPDMTDEEKAHILGVQANLWTEYIATESHLHYMLLPRMAALSEVQWCEPENKNWDRFYNSASHLASIYDAAGYNYGKHMFYTMGNVSRNPETSAIEIALRTSGDIDIRYTLDGSEPDENSALYTEPVQINGTCTFKARNFREGMEDRTFVRTFLGHKAMGREVSIAYAPHRSYTFNCPDMLTDGIRGASHYRSGEWAGWYREPFEAVIDMGGEIPYSKVTIGTFIEKGDFIFNPLDLTISTSEDGNTYQQIAKADFPAEGRNDANGIKDFSVTFPETSSRYLKVTATTITSLPDWHVAAGYNGFLFVDEVMVN